MTADQEVNRPRFVWLLDSSVGPGFVHFSWGLRVVVTDFAIAVHVGLFFAELLLQWNRKFLEAAE